MAKARAAKTRARAPAQTRRLERGEGKTRVFWEISRTKALITTRFGKYLSEGRRVEKTLADDDEAKEMFAKLIADKQREGYGDPPRKVAPGAASVKGVSVRNPELEALIDDDPTDPEGYLVYADWLQQQGDVRGELIVVQHGLSLDPDDAALERAETALLKQFEDELLGPLAKYTHIRTTYRSFKALAWRYGFLRAARLRRIGDTPISEVVRMLLEHPSGRFLERLVLGRVTYGTAPEHDLAPVFRMLSRVAPRTLRWLLVGDGYAETVDLGALWGAMPGLRCLVVQGPAPQLGTIAAGSLEELVVSYANHAELEAIARAEWPMLRRLAVTLTVPTESSRDALKPLFASKGLPSLTHLSVQRWMVMGEQGEGKLLPHDALALDTVRFAASRGLARLDLHMPLSEAGARELLAERGAAVIGTLALPREAIDSAALRASLADRLRNIVWTDAPVERALGDLETLDSE